MVFPKRFLWSAVLGGIISGIITMLCVCLSQRGRLFLGQIRLNAEAKTENLTLLCTLIKHALSTNQCTRYIETFLSGRM